MNLTDRPKFTDYTDIQTNYGASTVYRYFADLGNFLIDLDAYLVEKYNIESPDAWHEILPRYTDDEIDLLEKNLVWHDYNYNSYDEARSVALEKEKANRAFEKIILDK